MSDPDRRTKRSKHIRDARGRKVTQLDPVALHVLQQNEPVEREVLAAIISEKGIRMTRLEKAAMILSLVLLAALIVTVIIKLLGGDPWSHLLRRMVPTFYLFIWPFIVWGGTRASRFGKIGPAMLKHQRCPHCGYDLRNLPIDGADGATVCPECGCAWKLEPSTEKAT
ncbi:MAG: hypothetical protein SYC29_10635 [Planctomycetota bacterium]|nr:hypothetical protein [Planctomycetota bacterium]